MDHVPARELAGIVPNPYNVRREGPSNVYLRDAEAWTLQCNGKASRKERKKRSGAYAPGAANHSGKTTSGVALGRR
jgi:hypothetical protein